jgi:hypothetical protein
MKNFLFPKKAAPKSLRPDSQNLDQMRRKSRSKQPLHPEDSILWQGKVSAVYSSRLRPLLLRENGQTVALTSTSDRINLILFIKEPLL